MGRGAAGGVAGGRGRSGMKIIYRFTYPNPWWSSRRRMATPEAATTLEEILELVGRSATRLRKDGEGSLPRLPREVGHHTVPE